jgi:hypothetical protein
MRYVETLSPNRLTVTAPKEYFSTLKQAFFYHTKNVKQDIPHAHILTRKAKWTMESHQNYILEGE